MFQITWRDRSTPQQVGTDKSGGEADADRDVSAAGVILWEEHCVECSAPQCYSSCALYVPRRDQKCARFVKGITPNRAFDGLFGFGAEIQFRRWAKLEAILEPQLVMLPPSLVRAQCAVFDMLENVVSGCATLLSRFSPRRRLNGAFSVLRRALIAGQNRLAGRIMAPPEQFYLKCFSMEQQPFTFQLEVVDSITTFRAQIPISPGWNEHCLDATAMLSGGADGQRRVRISVEGDREVRVVFTWLDFVRFKSTAGQLQNASAAPATKVKCVAWDLDNTLWKGVIGDAGPDGVELNPEMADLIRTFDERGILQTIVSKNTYAVAWPKLEELQLDQYFLYPAINWGPKSTSLLEIAKELNINVDTFAVIDDSEFERAEIRSALPQVRVFDPVLGAGLLEKSCFDVPVTNESRTRRQSYRIEAARRSIQAAWRGDFDEFLRSCELQLTIARADQDSSARCLELLQRSNQFNLSGRRYDAEQLQSLLKSPQHLCLTLDVADRFGAYGIVGFAAFAVIAGRTTLIEFVLSCRVAQKKIEEAFFLWYASQRSAFGETDFQASLRVTSRNEPLRSVLSGLGFVMLREHKDEQELSYTFPSPVQLSSLIRISDAAGISAGPRLQERFAA
jgi:FkbH-like protein